MGSRSRLGLLIGLGLLLSGGLAYGVGMYQESSACTSGYWMTVDRMGADEQVYPPIEAVAFENLSTAEQEHFREAYGGNRQKLCSGSDRKENLTENVIRYQGDRYTADLLAFDGTSWGFPLALIGMAAILLGGGLSVIMGGMVILRRIWGRLLIT